MPPIDPDRPKMPTLPARGAKILVEGNAHKAVRNRESGTDNFHHGRQVERCSTQAVVAVQHHVNTFGFVILESFLKN
ncbi:uncharacterized protein EAF02_006815 [Botrytis sinoallii]|uniref:uncharacterized protein n=1 Tax=Botrytis sinoallii TaxID=1463999 RepID=UPI001901B691|nr:uncharacterized protein EAF02_006815 [Botrytis sinoallii]KAF7880924.1 hypothetical protein EAF02_006815 [Botrytis sinoallii]